MRGLTKEELIELQTLKPGWSLSDDGKSMQTDITFDSFKQAWSFMCEIALSTEAQNHHPEWSNVNNLVSIRLTTHDAGGLTDKDLQLARDIFDALGGCQRVT